MTILIAILLFALTGVFHYTIFWHHGEAYIGQMYDPNKPETWREGVVNGLRGAIRWIGDKLGVQVMYKLELLGKTKADFAKQIIAAPTIFFFLTFFFAKVLFRADFGKSLMTGLVFAGLGLVLTRVALAKGVQENRAKLIYAVPDLVNNLKISLIAGDTVEAAVRGAVGFSDGPVRKMLLDLLRRSEGEMEFGESLEYQINHTEEPEVLMVLHRLQSYNSAGIANRRQVFEDMAEHLARVRVDRATAILEGIKTPLFFLMLAGLLSLLLRIGVPILVITFKQFLGT